MTAATRARVVIADDHTLLRDALRTALPQFAHDAIEIVGEASNGVQAQEVAVESMADVVLMDIAMPLSNGFDATRQLARTHPEIAVIIVSEHADEGHIIQGIRAGARGYFSKTTTLATLVEAIAAVVKGNTVLDSGATSALVSEFKRLSQKLNPQIDGIGLLSQTELTLLSLVSLGLCNKEIAARMYLAESTVKNRLSVLFRKINVLDRTQAAIYGLRHGLVTTEPIA